MSNYTYRIVENIMKDGRHLYRGETKEMSSNEPFAPASFRTAAGPDIECPWLENYVNAHSFIERHKRDITYLEAQMEKNTPLEIIIHKIE